MKVTLEPLPKATSAAGSPGEEVQATSAAGTPGEEVQQACMQGFYAGLVFAFSCIKPLKALVQQQAFKGYSL